MKTKPLFFIALALFFSACGSESQIDLNEADNSILEPSQLTIEGGQLYEDPIPDAPIERNDPCVEDQNAWNCDRVTITSLSDISPLRGSTLSIFGSGFKPTSAFPNLIPDKHWIVKFYSPDLSTFSEQDAVIINDGQLDLIVPQNTPRPSLIYILEREYPGLARGSSDTFVYPADFLITLRIVGACQINANWDSANFPGPASSPFAVSAIGNSPNTMTKDLVRAGNVTTYTSNRFSINRLYNNTQPETVYFTVLRGHGPASGNVSRTNFVADAYSNILQYTWAPTPASCMGNPPPPPSSFLVDFRITADYVINNCPNNSLSLGTNTFNNGSCGNLLTLTRSNTSTSCRGVPVNNGSTTIDFTVEPQACFTSGTVRRLTTEVSRDGGQTWINAAVRLSQTPMSTAQPARFTLPLP